MSGSRLVTALAVLVCSLCCVLWVGGCGSSGGEEEAGVAVPSYPPGLSAESSPREVAETLIRALDADDQQTLLGLVAVKHSAAEIGAIYRKYGRESDMDPAEVARLAVSGWAATYAWFEVGATRVTGEWETGDTTTVEAEGLNPSTGRPRLLQIEMMREDGVWKVASGLESREL